MRIWWGGGVAKWSKAADCKSAGYAFVGSNPTSFNFLCLREVSRTKKNDTVRVRLCLALGYKIWACSSIG